MPEVGAAAGNVQIVDISEGPFEDKNRCRGPKEKFLKGLADHGVNTIIRYYSDEDNLPCKNITKYERGVLHDYGFNVAIVYQYKGRTPGRYTKESGNKDAGTCLARAEDIKQPDGSVIYFGIDADTATHDPAGVIEYFDQVGKRFAGRFQVGCYAAGEICKKVLARQLVTHTWVPEAPAWQGTRSFMNSGDWTFYQNKTDMTKSGLARGHGVEVDTNIVNPKFDTIGAFGRDGTIAKYEKGEVEAIASARKWVSRDELAIFDEPNGSKTGHMCIARMVRVLKHIDANWVEVDIDEDGAADGVCEVGFLSPLAEMPEWTSRCKPMAL